ncbi:MAG: DUF1385 domain-containing protein [Lachnospiraceae bacterium]|nr:DUF1385 domain-containing protein [Lachnospiraceae bacterium]
MRPSGIGGQAVIEGVMMKNGNKYAVAVRKPNKEICVEVKETKSISEKYPLFKLPILRGMAAFVESLSLGMSSLTFSSSFYEEEEEESRFEKKLNEMTKGKADGILNGLTVAFSVVLALGIFVVLPMLLAGLLGKIIESELLLAVLEGVFRVLIFVLYIVLISRIKDIQRLFMYHGAEHKAINCIENGLALTVGNVRKQSREHKRCGTSFMLTVMVISVLFFMFIRVDNPLLRLALRLLLIPVIAGISYEFIRYAGKHDNVLINVLSRPGMWLQALTTREPDKEMIEVAIQSVEAVFDWKTFVEEERKRKRAAGRKAKKTAEQAVKEEVLVAEEAPVAEETPVVAETPAEEVSPAAEVVETAEEIAAANEPVKENPAKEEPVTPVEIDIAQLFDIKLDTANCNQKKTKSKSKAPKTAPKKDPIPAATKAVSAMKDDDDDDILKALDMYFEFSGPKSVMEISDEETGGEDPT